MKVTYYYRKPAGFYSIERVFDTVQKAMPDSVSIRRVYCRYDRGLLGLMGNVLQARFLSGRGARGAEPEITHITGDVYYVALGLSRKRTVLTVHDLGSIKFRSGWRRDLVRLLWFEWPLRRASAVTVISESTRDDLLRLTSCPEGKISVIPDPLPPGFAPAPGRFCVDEPRLLQIGTIDCKNLEKVAPALEGVRCHLTIIGRLSGQQERLLDQCRIRYTARAGLTDPEIIEAYREADVVLLCSLHEGFGMPLIEANALGRPVVTSDIEPLRSVAGGAACLVNPHDVESIRAGILRVIGDAGYREELVERGFVNARRFDAAQIANSYLCVYQGLLAAPLEQPRRAHSTCGNGSGPAPVSG